MPHGSASSATLPKIALAGVGKIARDQHVPAIARTGTFTLAATLSRSERLPDVPGYQSFEALRAAHPDLDAIALCTPPQARIELACAALEAGIDLLLEKPPAASLSAFDLIRRTARDRGRVLFATWHSRFAAAVPAARDWLARHPPQAVEVIWREDVRKWHPGQTWLWQPGGMGVFDPGINALSILTGILPEPLILTRADLDVPSNCGTPIAARLGMRTAGGIPVEADFDFRQTGPQTWSIRIRTAAGDLLLRDGGAVLEIDGQPQPVPEGREYETLYRHFAQLRASGQSDADASPLALVADAFLLGQRHQTDPFYD